MKIKTNYIAVTVTAIALTSAPFLSGVAQAKDKGHDKKHKDNGKHLGWEKGKGNKHSEHRDDDRDYKDRDYKDRDYKDRHDNDDNQWPRQYPRPTNTRPSSTRDFGTRASAERAAAARRRLGYRTVVTYDARRKVYVLREYGTATNPRTNPRPAPRPTGRLVGTYYRSSQAEAAKTMRYAQSKGLRATSTYNSAQRVWIVRTYTR